MLILLVVTKCTKANGSHHGGKPATQTNRDPNHDKTLAWFNKPVTSKTYRRQDDVSGYELQFLPSGVLPVFNAVLYLVCSFI